MKFNMIMILSELLNFGQSQVTNKNIYSIILI